jgi:hypothetical protein
LLKKVLFMSVLIGPVGAVSNQNKTRVNQCYHPYGRV